MANAKEIGLEIQKLKAQTESLEQLVTLGDLYLEQGDTIESQRYYHLAIEKYPKNADGYLRLGKLAMSNDIIEEAENQYQKAIDADKSNIAARIGLVKIYLKKNGLSRAKEEVDRILKIDATNPDGVFIAGMVKMLAHDYYNAEKLLVQASSNEKNANFAMAKYLLGLMYAKQGWFVKAEKVFNSLKSNSLFSDLNSKNGQALVNNAALVQLRLGNIPAAEALLVEITSKAKNVEVEVLQNLAMVYWIQDKTADAVANFKKVNAINPGIFPWINELDEYLKTGAKGLKEKIGKLMKNNPNGYNIALYLGCIIPNRYPFIEAATRHFLNEFKIGVADMEGASCCPAPGVFRSFDIDTWLAIGSRNVVLAEELNRDLITMCNGCYGTLNDINTELKHDAAKKKKVNEVLAKINKQYKGTQRVRHIMDVIINDIGMDEITKRVSHKLNLKLAVHYGCHIVKPTKNKPWKDNFEGPEFFDKLVEATGCTSIPYRDKLMCCGAGGAVRTGAKEVAIDFTKEKLINMRNAGVDAVVLACPFCALQFDLGQNEVNATFKDEIGEPFRFPIIYVTQLLGLAMGMDPFRLGLLRSPKIKGVPPFIPMEPIFTQYLENVEM